MNNTTNNAAADASDDAQHLIKQLDALQPGKRQQKSLQFRKLYPGIERALAREVPQKAIISELEKMGLPLSMGGFRSLLEDERKRRHASGDSMCCEQCGSALSRRDGTSGQQPPVEQRSSSHD